MSPIEPRTLKWIDPNAVRGSIRRILEIVDAERERLPRFRAARKIQRLWRFVAARNKYLDFSDTVAARRKVIRARWRLALKYAGVWGSCDVVVYSGAHTVVAPPCHRQVRATKQLAWGESAALVRCTT